MKQRCQPTLEAPAYEAIAKVAQALASGNWLQLLEFLAQRERSVDELAGMTGLTVGTRRSTCRRCARQRS